MAENTDDKAGGSLAYVLFVCIVAAVGGLLRGYDNAIISGTVVFLEQHFSLTPSQLGIAVGNVMFGCIIGASVAGILSDRFGRKKILIVCAFMFFISAVLTGLSPNLPFFIVARFIGGLAIGISSPISPMYIAEIAPAHIRGRLVTMNQLTTTFGILAALLVGWFIGTRGTEQWQISTSWRWTFGSEALPAGLFTLILCFVPESPRWLVKNGQLPKARAILSRIGGSEHARVQIESIQNAVAQEAESFWQLFRPGLRMALFIGVMLMIFSQITGSNILIVYTPKILLELGFESMSAALGGMVMVGAALFFSTIFTLCVIDKIGRKVLLLLSAGGMTVCLLMLALQFEYNFMSPVAVISFVLAAIAFYDLGIASVSWVVISEIFPTRTRGRATAACSLTMWIASFTIVSKFPLLFDRSQAGAFLLFTAMAFAMGVFTWFFVPETKGKTLEEIEQSWKKS